MVWDEIGDVFAIGWDSAVALIGTVVTGLIAVSVALFVSRRDDRRQREAERRAVQRETIIALQDGWLELDEMLTNTLHLIQRHQSTSNRYRSELKAEREALAQGEAPDGASSLTFEQQEARDQARADEVNQSGDEMVDAVIDLRQFARRIELLESRVTSSDVRLTSRAMREWVEAMIVDLGSKGGARYGRIRSDSYQPAYDRFIAAGYAVLADIDDRDREGRDSRSVQSIDNGAHNG